MVQTVKRKVRRNWEKLAGYAAVTLLVVQLLLLVASWVIAAALPTANVRSLLSGEGIRWFFGSFAENLSNQLLLYLVIGSIALSFFRTSGLLSVIKSHRLVSYRQRFAFQMVVLELLLAVIVMMLLTMLPHAVLLSATGRLFPSSFSDSMMPIMAFLLSMVSVTYGVTSGKYGSVGDIIRGLVGGFTALPVILLLYVLGAELWFCFQYVFGAF